MKTAKELNALKEEMETLNKKLADLSEEEMEQVAGGSYSKLTYYCPNSECAYLKTKGKQFEKHLEGNYTKLPCRYCHTFLKIRL